MTEPRLTTVEQLSILIEELKTASWNQEDTEGISRSIDALLSSLRKEEENLAERRIQSSRTFKESVASDNFPFPDQEK